MEIIILNFLGAQLFKQMKQIINSEPYLLVNECKIL
jgi:hypothetical protein